MSRNEIDKLWAEEVDKGVNREPDLHPAATSLVGQPHLIFVRRSSGFVEQSGRLNSEDTMSFSARLCER